LSTVIQYSNSRKWKTQPRNAEFRLKVNYVTFGLCNGDPLLSECFSEVLTSFEELLTV